MRKKNEEKVKFLKRLTDESKTNGTIHAMAHSMLGKHYETVGDFKKAEHDLLGTA